MIKDHRSPRAHLVAAIWTTVVGESPKICARSKESLNDRTLNPEQEAVWMIYYCSSRVEDIRGRVQSTCTGAGGSNLKD